MIPTFQFRSVPTLIVEWGVTGKLGELLRKHYPHVSCVGVVTDGFLHGSGLLDPALESVQASGLRVIMINTVIADPPEHVVLDAADLARSEGVEIVVGMGGGSSLDVAKLVAVLLGSHQTLDTMYGVDCIEGVRLPLVQIPTTAGTGAEVTSVAIVTTGQTTKAGVVSPKLYADIAILDAELTIGLPSHVTAATGVDAMVHAIEAFTSARMKNPLSDMLARRALELLSRNIIAACRDGADRGAREAMLLGASLAGQAFSNAPVAAIHALAYPLGSVFHIPHGVSNALLLPHVLRFNASHAAHLYADVASWIVVPYTHDGVTSSKTNALIDFLERILEEIGLPRTLKAVGVTRDDLPGLVNDAMKQQRLLINNPRAVSREDALAIYEAAF